MKRRQFLGFVGAGSVSALGGCCLPPVFRLSADEALSFTPKLSAGELLGRLHFTGPAVGFMSAGAKEALVAKATQAVSILGAGYELISFGPPGKSAVSFVDGTTAVWVKIPPKVQLLSTGAANTASPWDRSHDQVDRIKAKLAVAFTGGTAPAVFVEPNFEQPFPYDRSWTCRLGSSSGDEPQINGSRNADWPSPSEGGLEWHRGLRRSQLDAASEATKDQQKTVRIAHLDTGFDPQQLMVPVNLDAEDERNFLNGAVGKDSAADPGKPGGPAGWGCFNSHGTGTLSLLAGGMVKTPSPYEANGPLGAAPNAVVVPVRVADSVIHLYSITMAQGIMYASLPKSEGGAECDVISISAGGLPSQLWADAVNYAYEHGIVIAAATGDNIGGLPTRGAVWPARFRRTLAVAGATSDDTPYDAAHSKSPNKLMMEGSYGPRHVMEHALSAYTPNTAWAHWEGTEVTGKHVKIDVDGGGTSAATPQVAGAAALYLAKNAGLPKDWRRTEIVRQALLITAQQPAQIKDATYYLGKGILKANDALGKEPASLHIAMEKPDVICSPFLEALLGVPGCDYSTNQMLVLETAQLLASDVKYERAYADWDSPDPFVTPTGKDFTTSPVASVMSLLLADTRKSATLDGQLRKSARELRLI